ncbi:EAL domain-containing protein [Paraglaciecola marina]|uniref:EAL domain-containing response regulator n=1 Tax=Paraglaciecola marina TaxID=2500157 RepID=UPI001060CDDD|nr:EAL domain-containing protein [Paraglaciecola marina]
MLNMSQQPAIYNPVLQDRSLLVVDDEENILKAIQRSFKHTKYRVYTASSAEEALKMLELHDVQVVLSDFRMPEVNGGALVKDVQLQHPDIVSMILTGQADFHAAVDVLNSGAAYKFLSKPWNNKELIEEVDQAFDEYQQRFIAKSKEHITQQYVKPERVLFDRAAEHLLLQNEKFAVASIIVSDLSLLDCYWQQHEPNTSILSSVESIISTYLSPSCEVFEVDVDQLLVIIPESECNANLHDSLVVLGEALSLTCGVDKLHPKLASQLAYAESPFEGSNIAQLVHSIRNISNSDYVEHLTKGQNSDVIRLDAAHLAQKKRKQTIQNSIQQAISSNQFCLYFQPKVNLSNGIVERAEVLMRWEHSSLGWVSPEEFISLSELDGQIEKIGTWLFKKSIADLVTLRKQYGDKVSLAINVSPRQLQTSQIVEEFTYLLQETGLSPECIELEITEGCVIDDLEQTGKILWELKDLGLRIAIDDFGSGYASFAYLSKLPVDVLKLDKVLIDDLETNNDMTDMLKSIIDLCGRMRIEVVAEGVENERQVNMLKELGCHYIQGYVYSRPITRENFEKILINQPFIYPKEAHP